MKALKPPMFMTIAEGDNIFTVLGNPMESIHHEHNGILLLCSGVSCLDCKNNERAYYMYQFEVKDHFDGAEKILVVGQGFYKKIAELIYYLDDRTAIGEVFNISKTKTKDGKPLYLISRLSQLQYQCPKVSAQTP